MNWEIVRYDEGSAFHVPEAQSYISNAEIEKWINLLPKGDVKDVYIFIAEYTDTYCNQLAAFRPAENASNALPQDAEWGFGKNFFKKHGEKKDTILLFKTDNKFGLKASFFHEVGHLVWSRMPKKSKPNSKRK